MLFALDRAAHALVAADRPLPRGGWIHVVAPTAAERARLVGELGAPASLIDHALDVDEVARVDHDPSGAALIVVRVPARGSRGHRNSAPYHSHAVGVIAIGEQIITLTHSAAPLFDALAADPDLTLAPRRFALRLLHAATGRFVAELATVEHTVARIEGRLGSSLGNQEVLELLRYQRALVFFDNALRSNALMLERLGHDRRLGDPAADAELVADVDVELRQAQQVTEIASEILSQTMDAFASIVSNNLNVVMKVLTALTIVLALPTMVSSFYGMNVALPMQHRPWAFAGALVVSLLLMAGTAAYFWKRRWL